MEIKDGHSILEGNKARIKFQYYPTTQTAETAVKLSQVHGLPNYGSLGNTFKGWSNFQVKISTLAYQEVMAFLI